MAWCVIFGFCLYSTCLIKWVFPLKKYKHTHACMHSLKQTPAWLSGIPLSLTPDSSKSTQSVDFTGAVSVTCNWHPVSCQSLFFSYLFSQLIHALTTEVRIKQWRRLIIKMAVRSSTFTAGETATTIVLLCTILPYLFMLIK